MLIKDLEKLRKRTLRERIYEEIVHLILSGELPSGAWVDEKQVIHKLRVSRTPFREAIGILAKGGLVEIRPYRGFYVRSFSRDETADIYELFKRLQCFAVKLAMPLMSDRDIDGFENILLEGVVALQRGDVCLPSTACNRADSGTSQSKRAEIVRPAAGVANASMPGSLLTSIG